MDYYKWVDYFRMYNYEWMDCIGCGDGSLLEHLRGAPIFIGPRSLDRSDLWVELSVSESDTFLKLN